MTNHEKWRAYTSGLPSPDNYIDWSWRYIIAASLQRRVWLPPSHQPCFANMYAILVGKAGLGKGLCIREVSDILKHWKLKDFPKRQNNGHSPEQMEIIEAMRQADLKNAQDSEMKSNNRRNNSPEPSLIPVAADATTYEALVSSVASSYRRIDYEIYDEKLGKNVTKPYGHSSICFSLQELASLLRKRTDDTVNYMLGLYDCPMDYEYDTKTQGKDRVLRGCLNLFAGTTPDFMQKIFNAELINQGFGSRTFFIYANKDRYPDQFWIPELTAEQKNYKKELLDHILKLTTLYGAVTMSESVKSFLSDWWKETSGKRVNDSSKLEGYYSRKKVHVMKLALAEHFSESIEMDIPVETYQKAIGVLEKEEKNMHMAIIMEGDNPIYKIACKILEMLRSGRKADIDVKCECHPLGPFSQIEEAISNLKDMNQIDIETEKDNDTDQTIVYYKIK